MGRHLGTGHPINVREQISRTMCKGLPEFVVCSTCKIQKSISNFYHYKTDRQGLNSYRAECKTCMKRKSRLKYEQKHPDAKKNQALKNTFGITLADYNEIFRNQEGKCKICDTPQTNLTKALAVDHNHATGRIRGLLCHDCNLGIGFLKEQPALFDKAKAYLIEGVYN